MRLLLMGAPGSGKGTQGALIAQHYRIPAISTGDIFRGMLATQTPLAQQVREIMAAGGYVPDDITNTIVAERLAHPDCGNGFVLDGYPRTLHQVGTLDFLLAHDNAALDAVIGLQVDTDEVVARLMARATVDGRADDTEETIALRQRIYREQTEPLLDTYRRRGLLVDIDAQGSPEVVFERISTALDALAAVAV